MVSWALSCARAPAHEISQCARISASTFLVRENRENGSGTGANCAAYTIFVTLYWDEHVVLATFSRVARLGIEIFYEIEPEAGDDTWDTHSRPQDTPKPRSHQPRTFPREQTYPSWDLAPNRKFVCSPPLNASSHR